MMLKVLIVDDEPIIREGLKSIIPWERCGFTVCGEAENAEEGLKKIAALSPDLAIVDIKMPVMNGLEMVEVLRSQKNQCRVILLSAYSDFKFAQKAVELGIDSYVLKPIEQDELIEKLEKVKAVILRESSMKQFMDSSILLSKDKVLETLILGQMDKSLMHQYNELFGLNLPWNSYQVGLLHMIYPQNEGNPPISVYQNVKKTVEDYLLKNHYGFVFDIHEFLGILFKNIYMKLFPHILMNLKQEIIRKCNMDCIISLGIGVETIEEMSRSYQHARQLLDQKFIYGHKKIIMDILNDPDMASLSVKPSISFDLDKLLHQLYSAVDANNMDQINNILEEIKCNFIHNAYSEEFIKINYTNLYTALINKLESNNISTGHFVPNIKSTLDDIFKSTSINELHGYMKYTISSISDELAKFRPGNRMDKILDYIDRNYSKSIKLEAIALLYNYNSAYLGTVFKSHCGMTFNKYLDLIRIKKAKLFLKEGEKIAAVAEKSGYHDMDYFYKKFRKYEGISPSEYKEKYRNGQ